MIKIIQTEAIIYIYIENVNGRVYVCIRVLNASVYASFHDFSLESWNCCDSVVFFFIVSSKVINDQEQYQ